MVLRKRTLLCEKLGCVYYGTKMFKNVVLVSLLGAVFSIPVNKITVQQDTLWNYFKERDTTPLIEIPQLPLNYYTKPYIFNKRLLLNNVLFTNRLVNPLKVLSKNNQPSNQELRVDYKKRDNPRNYMNSTETTNLNQSIYKSNDHASMDLSRYSENMKTDGVIKPQQIIDSAIYYENSNNEFFKPDTSALNNDLSLTTDTTTDDIETTTVDDSILNRISPDVVATLLG